MKFVEIALPRNESDPGLLDNMLINLDGILEIYVRALLPEELDARGYAYGLFVACQSTNMRFHGTKKQCEHGYKDLRAILDNAPIESERNGIVETFTFPAIPLDEE